MKLIALVRPVAANPNSVLIDCMNNRRSKRARYAKISRHSNSFHKYANAQMELNKTIYHRSIFGAFTITAMPAIWHNTTASITKMVRWHACSCVETALNKMKLNRYATL